MDYDTFAILRDAFAPTGLAPYRNDSPKLTAEVHQTIGNSIRRHIAVHLQEGMELYLHVFDEVFSNVTDYIRRVPDHLRALPWIDNRKVDAAIQRLGQEVVTPTQVAAMLAAYIFATRSALSAPSWRNFLIETELNSFTSWMQVNGFKEAAAKLISLEQKLDEEKNQAFSKVDDKVQQASEAVIELQRLGAEAQGLIEESRQRSGELKSYSQSVMREWDSAEKNIQEQIADASARLTALQEGIATISAKSLWDDRAAEGRNAFLGSAATLAALLVLLPIFAFYHLDAILALLRHIGEATTLGLPSQPTNTQVAIAAISRLVVITLPIVLYLWVVRLVVRFNSRSLLLQDDAKQRHTMMDTYFHLIERKVASTEDRALMLAALFRPTPGHGADNVEPPNFTELVKTITK